VGKTWITEKGGGSITARKGRNGVTPFSRIGACPYEEKRQYDKDSAKTKREGVGKKVEGWKRNQEERTGCGINVGPTSLIEKKLETQSILQYTKEGKAS